MSVDKQVGDGKQPRQRWVMCAQSAAWSQGRAGVHAKAAVACLGL
jgi:hypothetical protein